MLIIALPILNIGHTETEIFNILENFQKIILKIKFSVDKDVIFSGWSWLFKSRLFFASIMSLYPK